MTKFVLAGGYPTKTQDNGKAFAEELVEGFDQPVRILDCLFARPEDTWQDVFEQDKFFFASRLDQKVSLVLADPANFMDQLKKADVVYFRGGATKSLLAALKNAPGWEKELKGKTVAGTSAGANMLARYYYSLDTIDVFEGLGILPVKVLVHYKSDYNAPNIDWEVAYQELEKHGEDLPILAIPEGGFEVIEREV